MSKRKIEWPKTVPMLTSKDMVRDAFRSEDGERFCLRGHMTETFLDSNSLMSFSDVKENVDPVLTKVIDDYVGEGTYRNMPHFNDDRKVPLKMIARVWNRAMYLLGYTENNDESKPLPKMTKTKRKNKKG